MDTNEPKETKSEIMGRLRREGRWDEASRYREEVRVKLRADGKTRSEASEGSWDAMREKFPALPLSESEGPESEAEGVVDEELQALYESSESSAPIDADLATDILWAYRNLEHRSVTAASAPNLGAWAMLQWARKARNRFFEYSLPKALITKAERDEKQDEEETQRSSPAMDEIERMLSEIDEEEAAEEAARDRVVNCPTCSQRILLVRPASKQYTSQLEYPEPCVCPATHPNYEQPAGV